MPAVVVLSVVALVLVALVLGVSWLVRTYR